ncbi:MAG: G protein-coupled receptor LGR4 [Planctomycetota bacterium]
MHPLKERQHQGFFSDCLGNSWGESSSPADAGTISNPKTAHEPFMIPGCKAVAADRIAMRPRAAAVWTWLAVGVVCGLLLGCETTSRPTVDSPSELDSLSQSEPEGTIVDWESIAGAIVRQRDDEIVVLDLRSVDTETLSPIVDRIQQLPRLTELFLPASVITTDLPGILKNCKSLTRLRIYGPSFSDDQMLTLIDFKPLQAITLQDTSVTDAGIVVLANMTNLREVSLMGTPVTDVCLTTLAKLSKLKKLRLRQTGITGDRFDPIAETAIEDLELAETEFQSVGMAAIAKMPSLSKLNLWMTKVNDAGLAEIKDDGKLTQLNLDNCEGVSNVSLPVILSLSKLKLLHIGGTSITPDRLIELSELKSLETLFITRLDADQAIASQLRSELPSLKRLEF